MGLYAPFGAPVEDDQIVPSKLIASKQGAQLAKKVVTIVVKLSDCHTYVYIAGGEQVSLPNTYSVPHLSG